MVSSCIVPLLPGGDFFRVRLVPTPSDFKSFRLSQLASRSSRERLALRELASVARAGTTDRLLEHLSRFPPQPLTSTPPLLVNVAGDSPVAKERAQPVILWRSRSRSRSRSHCGTPAACSVGTSCVAVVRAGGSARGCHPRLLAAGHIPINFCGTVPAAPERHPPWYAARFRASSRPPTGGSRTDDVGRRGCIGNGGMVTISAGFRVLAVVLDRMACHYCSACQ